MEWKSIYDFVQWVMLREQLGADYFDAYRYIKGATDNFDNYNVVKFKYAFCKAAEQFKDYVEHFFYEDPLDADYLPNDLCDGGYNEVLELLDRKLNDTNDGVTMQPQQEDIKQTKPNRGRGRERKTLKDIMMDDADGKKLQRLHEIWGNSRGKDAALIILVCMKIGWMRKPTYTQVTDEFGDIGNKSGFNRYLAVKTFTNEEIESVKAALINQ